MRPAEDLGLQLKVVISIHAPRKGCDPRGRDAVKFVSKFQSTHPARGATPASGTGFPTFEHFNPRTPQGVRLERLYERIAAENNFNPRTPQGVRRYHPPFLSQPDNISIHAPRKGCDRGRHADRRGERISIHAPRKGCDSMPRTSRLTRRISIHAPRKGCDARCLSASLPVLRISIHAPRKGCDRTNQLAKWPNVHFNPRTPQGVRRPAWCQSSLALSISIHAPRKGCDTGSPLQRRPGFGFQSTHPARGATRSATRSRPTQAISIHAPRKGCDVPSPVTRPLSSNFNPRTPQGVRPTAFPTGGSRSNFNPRTPQGVRPGSPLQRRPGFGISIHAPRKGCDWRERDETLAKKISIHAPRKGCDEPISQTGSARSDFNPRTPQGVRPRPASPPGGPYEFQSTHPARGATQGRRPSGRRRKISIHAPRKGCDAKPVTVLA